MIETICSITMTVVEHGLPTLFSVQGYLSTLNVFALKQRPNESLVD